jgi:hypothetical protein
MIPSLRARPPRILTGALPRRAAPYRRDFRELPALTTHCFYLLTIYFNSVKNTM